MIHCELLIDGYFIGGPCDQAVGKQVVRSPWDDTVVGTAAEGGLLELRTCIQAAHEAFATWRKSPPEIRRRLLHRIAELVRERSEELVELLTMEIGKPITASRGEVERFAITFELAASLVDHFGSESVPLDSDPRGVGYQARVERFPRGVIFCIVPYNWPFNLAAHKIAPALATGNTVVLKVSPLAPLSTLALARLIHEAGCPPGVVNAWNGPAPLAQKILVEDGRIRMLSFTGSAPVGWKLKGLMPDRMVTLELGGDASVIVHSDADQDWAAARIVNSAFAYAGQICISVQHALVHESIYESMREQLIAGTAACPTGDPSQSETICGPLISDEAANRVETWIEEAIAAGATQLVGGTRSGRTISPTLLEGVVTTTKLGSEEAFGPVLTLEPYATLEGAIQKVNASKYGIHTGFFTRDAKVAERAFREIEVGGVVINDAPTVRFDTLPYGGVRRSGFGREGVRYAMEEMTEPRSWVTRLG